MTRQIEITTGARLHFGLLSHAPATGGQFGGAGLMIDSPRFRIIVQPDERDVVEGNEEARIRCQQFVSMYRQNCPAHCQPPQCRILIQESVPLHRGLGSGTQLGMAVARGLSLMAGDADADEFVLARRANRGARSALGIHGFTQGGFLVDGGKRAGRDIGSLAAHAEFPPQWRLLLVTPAGKVGLAGTAESDAFSHLPGMPLCVTGRLRRIALMQLLPAVINTDFDTFADALFEFGRTVGEYFAPVQAGTYANPEMRQLVERLRNRGVQGVGQTSWGPTIFALTPDDASAERLEAEISADEQWSGCRFQIAAPMNSGAVVTIR